jgi:hypothetical protein
VNNKFIYFEFTEGGMSPYPLDPGEVPSFLRGWMDPDCRDGDTELVDWMSTAKPGEYIYHRLGALVCVI